MDKTELNELFSKMNTGDKLAFSRIYSELKQPVFTVALRIVTSRELAEDITHDVFVKLFISPPNACVKNARAYIFQLARNLAIDALRKKPCDNIDELALKAKDSIAPVDTRLDIEKAISLLSRDEREIISLRLSAELSFADISRIIGLSLPAVYRRYRKAINVLKTSLS